MDEKWYWPFFFFPFSFSLSLRRCRGPVSHLQHMCVTGAGVRGWCGGGGSRSAGEKGHFAISSFRSGLHVDTKVSIASRPSTSTTVDGGDEPHSLILPPRSHQACFITRKVKLSDCAATTVIFFLVPLCIYGSSTRLAVSLRWPLRRQRDTWSHWGNTISSFSTVQIKKIYLLLQNFSAISKRLSRCPNVRHCSNHFRVLRLQASWQNSKPHSSKIFYQNLVSNVVTSTWAAATVWGAKVLQVSN